MEVGESVFRPLLRERPGLEPFLRSLCEGINRRVNLRGMVALGRSQGRSGDFEPLVEVFGSRALSLSGSGDIRFSLEAFFSGIPAGDQETWLQDLFGAVGLTRAPRPLRRQAAASQVESLLERFRISFPDLEPVHLALRARPERWMKAVLSEGVDALQASWFQAAKAVRFLRDNREAMTLADLGARLCGDSKALKSGPLLSQVEEWLDLLERGDSGEGDMEGEGVGETDRGRGRSARLARFHIVENLGAVKATLFGPVVFWKDGRRFDFIREFWSIGEAATLTWENLRGVERLEIAGDGPVLACENESPFRRLQAEKFPGVLVYSQGFPNAAVLRLWSLLGAAVPEREFRHWGDSDLAGLRIAAILHRVHPLRLYRCDFPELRRHGGFLIPLDGKEKSLAARFREAHPDFPFRTELEFTESQGWLEQESWRAGIV